MPEPARSRDRRKQDALHRFEHDVDAWVATADSAEATPYLVPLSFDWDGATFLLATLATNPTGRNLHSTGQVRLAFGETRDVVLVEGTAQTLAPDDLSDAEGDAFARRSGFDPRPLKGYTFYRVRPRSVQAWREVDELADRELMRDGIWVV
ncbi:pyridoxamine 5'-phosphate oxidase family protein [Luteipulveratus sp. YIM 133132]|uniref:Pyridoxamine 5'-phosphate oxidase family protein n=1 Tax=Luteipulveratus flavus TaxID=3031728 RepID=A0ABT6C4D4_9MICO|nr:MULTISPECIES: pyridoxamine 5'-phosphate oxidase family protein [unclassified Luteipulveratus]MDE9364198.1 pyridoxamine 5'-phosphate oxidase family protein [Luteipulveratus sp. YIM 133132]MDF8263640.1 pyridoxamine 5'-phosphate oxidase family protein [Luteipulveratus sp. YIM 133296]